MRTLALALVNPDPSPDQASKEENTDLYYALPWSHGSLGLLVGLTLKA